MEYHTADILVRAFDDNDPRQLAMKVKMGLHRQEIIDWATANLADCQNKEEMIVELIKHIEENYN